MSRHLQILVAEDNDLFRQTLGCTLESDGHQVTLRSRGLETLRTLLEHSFDLLITDVKMPEMSGLEILRQVHQRGLEVPTIVISSQSYRPPPGARFLQKPFTLAELRCVVEEVVRRAS